MTYSSSKIALLEQMNLFFHVSAWLHSSNVSNASLNDLRFICNIIEYQDFDTIFATVAWQKLLKHPWYLEETVAYSLFSDSNKVRGDEKAAITKLLTTIHSSEFRLQASNFDTTR